MISLLTHLIVPGSGARLPRDTMVSGMLPFCSWGRLVAVFGGVTVHTWTGT